MFDVGLPPFAKNLLLAQRPDALHRHKDQCEDEQLETEVIETRTDSARLVRDGLGLRAAHQDRQHAEGNAGQAEDLRADEDHAGCAEE